ncbi:MAG: amidohydrolase family protein [Aestuariibacter sp.]
MKVFNKTKLALAALSLCVSAFVQAENIAIVGGTVHTMSDDGTIENATVLLEDGEIKSVRQDGRVPSGYRQIDASGKVVTPGIIAAFTSLGLVEVEYSAGIADNTTKLDDDSLGTIPDVQYAVNPDSSLMNITRIDGVTSAVSGLAYFDTIFGGQGAVITLGDKVNPIMKSNAVMTLDITGGVAEENGGSRAALWPKVMKVFAEAAMTKGRKIKVGDDWDGDFDKNDINALVPVINGEMPLLVSVHRLIDIRHLIKLKQQYSKVNMILLQATEAWRVAEELANHDIGVVFNPQINLPYDFGQLGATLSAAARLDAAGVKVAFGATSGVNTHNPRLAPQQAGNAVAHGLPWEKGLAAITINVAEMFGVDDRIGSLEKGKQADVVVWSGDPLEVMSQAEHVIIKGEEIPLTSRQTKLRDRYLNMQSDKPYRYIKP